jgi:hypothetical protein
MKLHFFCTKMPKIQREEEDWKTQLNLWNIKKMKFKESFAHKLNKFGSNNIIKSKYFFLTKSIYTLENKNPNGSTLVS